MRNSLAQQFVLAIVSLTLVVLLATLLLARWSFERGFAEYVNALERRRLEEAAALLLPFHDREEAWRGLSEGAFLQAIRARLEPPRARDRRPPPHREQPPPRPGGGRERPPPGEPGRGGPPGKRGVGSDPPPGGDNVVPTALFDAAGALVHDYRFTGFTTAAAGDGVLTYALVIDGQRVGELRSVPRRRLQSPRETEFAERQALASLVIFALALLLALLMALLLARRLLAPLRGAHAALARLAAGDYQQRIGSSRRDELGELMADIDQLAETLDRNQSARRRWLADISHELRTPVAVLKGELEALADGIRPFDGSQLASLQAEVQRLAKLIDDLYELSLADVGGLRYEFASVDLSALILGFCADYRGRLAAAGLTLEVQVEPECRLSADARRLEQLLRNLLENAMAYTDAPGTLRVALRAEGDHLKLCVDDSPPGVEGPERERLFDALYRRDESRSRRSAGAGLGLAICRAVVEAHGGSIGAAASDLGGLSLQVSLPRRST